MASSTLPGPVSASPDAGPGEDEGSEIQEVVIRPRSGWVPIDWAELVHFRELLFFLAWRDVKVRYKQTVLGVAWAVLQPLFTMVIFTLIFGRFAKIPSEGFDYPVFVFAGLIPWTFFATGIGQAGMSLVSQQHLLAKIYFPRLYVPTAAVCAYLIDLAIMTALYFCILFAYGVVPSWHVVFLPMLIGLALVLTLGLGYTLAAITVVYRDFRYLVSFFIQILMYLSPVIYPVSMVPARYRWMISLNPMCGLIGGFRWAFLGTPCDPVALGMSVTLSLSVFVFGLFYFRKTERRFADIA